MKTHALTLCLTLSLSGCTMSMAMKGLNGAGACNPETFRAIQTNVAGLSALPLPASIDTLNNYTTTPERTETLALRGGETAYVYYYRTGHPRCRNTGDEAEFTPVILNSHYEVLGIGPTAHRLLLNQTSARKDSQSYAPQPVSSKGALPSFCCGNLLTPLKKPRIYPA